MTTYIELSEICCICGKTSTHAALMSTSTFGASDLDARPPELARSTLASRVRRCPYCGYCAPELSAGTEMAKAIVQSAPYRQQLDNPSFPALANSFLCWAILAEASGDYPQAGWSCVFGAWACDDAHARPAADHCRTEAVRLFRAARTNGTPFAQTGGVEEVILADLLRRSGAFEQAIAVCQEGLTKEPEALIARLLTYEVDLASRRDTACHRVDEADQNQ